MANAWAAEGLGPEGEPGSSPNLAKALPRIQQIAVNNNGIPMLLDERGQVWAFTGLPSTGTELSYPLLRIPNLKNITRIASHMAIDEAGHVFLWQPTALGDNVPSSPPIQYKSLSNVTWISPESPRYEFDSDAADDPGIENPTVRYRYIVSVGNRDVYEIGVDGSGKELSPRRLYLSKGIRAISAYTSSEEDVIVILQSDGDLLRLEIRPKANQAHEREIHVTKLGNYPNVIDVSVNLAHVVMLDRSGGLTYIGQCDAVKKSPEGKWVPIPGQKAMASLLDGVTGLELHSIQNDDVFPNALIRTDGSVWIDSSPTPSPYWGGRTCAEIQQRDYAKKPEQIFHGSAPVKQAYFGDMTYYFLDANHDVWQLGGYNRMYNENWEGVKAKRLNLNFSNAIAGPGASEVKGIEEAALKELGSSNVQIYVIEVKGNFAHAVGIPVHPHMDGTSIYLKKENGGWTVTDEGSGAVPPEDYPE